jgi:transcription elongation factor Elf1
MKTEDQGLELKFVCPECERPSSSASWNKETSAKYGDDIFPIEDPVMNQAVFVCPFCKKENSGEVILEQSVYEQIVGEDGH